MGWFFTITEDMRQWGLSGNELLVFALVNTFSQGSQGCYWGSLEHTCECCGISRATAIRTFKALIDRGLITKNKVVVDENVRTIYYATRVSKCDPQSQNDTLEGIKMTPNIKDRYINNREIYKGSQAHFVKPSVSEVAAFCRERNNGIDPEEFVAFYDSKGWMVGKSPMKDWKAAIITWEKAKTKKTRQVRSQPRQESVFEHNLKVMDEMFGTNLHRQAYGGGQADEQ